MPNVDHVAVERAVGWVADLEQKIGEAQATLSTLNGFCAEEALAEALCGTVGSALDDARQQMRALRQAVRDMEGPLDAAEGQGRR